MSGSRQLSYNLIASVGAFLVTLGIGFFLAPYVVKHIGVEAYGFVALGMDFINYASLVSLALNSMYGRFITIAIHEGDWKRANIYFSSVFYANIAVSVLLIVPCGAVVFWLHHIINISDDILFDVQLLYVLLFFNYIIGLLLSCYTVATFATNKLHLRALREIESKFVKVAMLIILFSLLEPAVFFIGVSALSMSIYVLIFNIYYTKKLLPELVIAPALFDFKAVRELVGSGIWNTIISVGQLLLGGFDMLVSNLFISATAMGTLAVAKTLPNIIYSLVGVLAGAFLPSFTILFAKKNIPELLSSLRRSMLLLGVIINIPIGILFAFGEEFFALWVPGQDAHLLHILACLSVGTGIVSASINSIYGIFSVTNRLKVNAFALIGSGVLSISVMMVLLKTTDLGILAVAGVSFIVGSARNLLVTAPLGALYLNLKWTTFFPVIGRSVLGFLMVLGIGILLNLLVDVDGWFVLLGCCALTGLLGLGSNLLLLVGAEDRQLLLRAISRQKHS